MIYQTLDELSQVRILGRSDGNRRPVCLYWTASGLELEFDGGELWVELEADYTVSEHWISVELNGAWITRQMLPKGRHELCILRGMSPGLKHVRILKDVQAMPDDPTHCLKVYALRYDGQMLPLPEPTMRLEFVGDSITCGEGAIGAKCEEDWVPAFFSACNSYAVMTAYNLGAECRLVSLGGWGVRSRCDNVPDGNMPRIYESVCGGVDTPATRSPYDFASWPCDAVIINLGTNDEAAMDQPFPWQGPDGACFRQERTVDGIELWTQAAAKFLRTVRRCNPKAKIVWTYGMMTDGLWPAIQDAVARFGDSYTYTCKLPMLTVETVGARQHPGRANQLLAADTLTDFFRACLTDA